MGDDPHSTGPVTEGRQELSQEWVIGIGVEVSCRIVNRKELALFRGRLHDLIQDDVRVPLIIDIDLLRPLLLDEVIGGGSLVLIHG